MTDNQLPNQYTSDQHPPVKHGKIGVLMISLGTPTAPTYGALRTYLAEFLSDPRVIEMPRLLWLPILYGPLLTFRPLKSAKAYASIWDNEKGESPLRTIAREQAECLDTMMENVHVEWAFRYGEPTIEAGIKSLQDKGCDKILLFALYPHYSATTVASAYDKAFDVLGKMRWQPAIRTITHYHDEPVYIDALAASVKESLASLDWQPERIIASYHSIPDAYFQKGDPYPCHCRKTSRLLGEALDMDSDTLMTTFQSRVGPTKWVGPYTDHSVEALAKEGVKRIAVLAPAFSADCVETLEEINIELRDTFLEAGGSHFHYIPCLNAGDKGMKVLKEVAEQNLAGWL